MSLMKRYAEDKEELGMRAAMIAWNPDPEERKALRIELWSDCAKAAEIYHSPVEVAMAFVHHVAECYSAAFMQQKGETA